MTFQAFLPAIVLMLSLAFVTIHATDCAIVNEPAYKVSAKQQNFVQKKPAEEIAAAKVSDTCSAADGPANLPQGALSSFGRLPFHNGSRIHASEISPDGKLLATLSSRSATVWNTATGQPLHRFFFDVPSWPGYRRGLAFSPDSKRLACGPTSEHIFVWDLASGKEVRRFTTVFEMFGYSFLRFSADGAALIVESNDVLSWLNVETGAAIRRLPHGRIKQLSPDDKTFVIVRQTNRQVLIGDAVIGQIKHTLPIAAQFHGTDQGVLFLPDGITLAVVHYFEDFTSEVQFWNVNTGKRQERIWPLPKSAVGIWHRLTLSPDRKVLYSTLRRYSLEANKELPPIPLGWTTAVFPLPDGKTLIAVGLEEIHRWDVVNGKGISKPKDFIHWRETAISPDGCWLALRGAQSHDGFLELCDTASGKAKRIAWPWGNGAHIAFTSDGRSLAVNEYGHLQFLRVPEMAEAKKLAPAGKYDIQEASLHFSADARHLALVRDTGLMRLYDLTTDKEVWSLEDTSRALFTPDGKRLLAESRKDGKLRLHDLATKKTVFEVKRPVDRGNSRRGGARITDWAFSPDGRVLAVAMTGGHVCLLDAKTGKERSRFLSVPIEHPFGVDDYYLHATAIAFSPDGQWLAGGGDDGYLRIWDVPMRRELHRLHGHEGGTRSLGFSANGRRLVSFGDGEGLVWDLRPRNEIRTGSNPFMDLSAKEGPTVYRAVWTMADDAQAPAMLREKIPSKRVDIRPERIARLIGDLRAEQFSVRNAAMRSLAELEGIARTALVGAMEKNPPLEMKRRIETLLSEIDTPSETALQISRAVLAMELNVSDAARKLLQDWSEGTSGLRLTEESRAALARRRMSPGLNRR
jgi:WD40 repeat protein